MMDIPGSHRFISVGMANPSQCFSRFSGPLGNAAKPGEHWRDAGKRQWPGC